MNTPSTPAGKHTPTPWYCLCGAIWASEADAESDTAIAIAVRGTQRHRHLDDRAPTEKDANMRRIVACVNAMEGIATAAIEADGVGGVRKTMSQAQAAVLTAWDALNAARRNAHSRVYLLPLDADANTRAVLAKEHENLATACAELFPFVEAMTDTTGPEWAERN